MNKLLPAMPLYRQVPVQWFFNWLRMDKQPLVGTVATQGVYLSHAMEQLVDMAFLQFEEWDYLVVMEHDMIPPLDAFARMAQYDPQQHDIVGTMYFDHTAPHHVMCWHQIDPPLFSPLTAERTRQMVESPGLYKVDGVGFGFTAISRRVLESWSPDIPMFEAEPPLKGHDLHFCNQAKKQGFSVWIDSGIGCAHLTEMPIGYSDHQRCLADEKIPTWA